MPLTHLDDAPGVGLTWRFDVPADRVWHCLTDADMLGQWLGTLRQGRVGAGSTVVIDHGDDYCCRSSVLTCLEPSRLELTWHFPDEPVSRVALDLVESDGVTDLGLTHSALGDLAPSYRDGWCVHLSFLEAAALGSPLPPSMFWRLHATMARLRTR